MSTFVIEHDGTRITGWRYEVADDYAAGDGEVVAPAGVHHNNVKRYTLDTSGEGVSVVEDAAYDPRTKTEQRLDSLESATGIGEPAERGIAARLDDIEDRLKTLENEHNL